MSLSPQFLDELRNRTLLSALIGRSVKLQKAGREFRACCPFHDEKTPSFYVNDDKGFYHCFGCSAHGDAIRFLTDAKGMPFMEAVKDLAQAAGLDMPAPDPRSAERAERATGLIAASEAAQRWFIEQLQGITGAEARAYLAKRGVPDELAKAFGLGFSPDSRGKLKAALSAFGNETLVEAGLLISVEEKDPYDRFRGRLMFPVRDARGRTIAFGGRILDSGEPKYLNSPDTPLFDKGRTLYNLDRAGPASRKANRVIVVEGYMDVIALAKADIHEVVAPLGTALTEAQLERLWRLVPTPILCFDGDSAGQKAAARAAIRALPMVAPGRSLSFAILPAGKDPDDLIREKGRAAFEEIIEHITPLHELIWANEVAAEPLSTPEARASLGKRLREKARLIADEDTRVHYLGIFSGRLEDMFASIKRTAFSPTGKRIIEAKRASADIRAINEHGIDQAVIIRAVLLGLRRLPHLLAGVAEGLALLWIKNRGWAQVREALVGAALVPGDLEAERLEAILDQEGLRPVLTKMAKPNDLAFSFLRGDAPSATAENELVSVLEALAVGPNIDEAIEAAVRRFEAPDINYEDANRELERLLELKRETDQTFTDLWRHSLDAEA